MYFTDWQIREMRDEAGVVWEFIELHKNDIKLLYGVDISIKNEVAGGRRRPPDRFPVFFSIILRLSLRLCVFASGFFSKEKEVVADNLTGRAAAGARPRILLDWS